MTDVVLWRHGRTEYNQARRLQGQVDIPLDDVGRWQAATGAAALYARVTPVKIISSDLQRAAATAHYLAEIAGVPVETDPRLRERSFGEVEGFTLDEIREQFPEHFEHWRAGGTFSSFTGGGVELQDEVAARIVAAVTEHANGDGTVVFVTHGAAIALGISGLLGQEVSTWRGVAGVDNAHWSHLVPTVGGAPPGWRLLGHNMGPSVSAAEWAAGRLG